MSVHDYINSVQYSPGEEQEEKWHEKGYGRIEGDVVKEPDINTMGLGADMDSCAQDLVDSRWNLEAVEAAGEQDEERLISLVALGGKDRCAEVDKHGTTEEPDNCYRPHISHAITNDAIKNPCVLPIRTASEWDPGPGEPVDANPAMDKDKDGNQLTSGDIEVVVPVVQNSIGIVVRTTPRNPTHPVAEYLWPPEFGTQQAYRRIPIPIQNTRLGSIAFRHGVQPREPQG